LNRSLRLLLLAVVFAAAPLAAPDLAAAHVSLYNYKFPLPLWVFLTGGALAVLLSAPAPPFAAADRRDWTTRSFYPLVRAATPETVVMLNLFGAVALAV
jgi:hypothetical protein